MGVFLGETGNIVLRGQTIQKATSAKSLKLIPCENLLVGIVSSFVYMEYCS